MGSESRNYGGCWCVQVQVTNVWLGRSLDSCVHLGDCIARCYSTYGCWGDTTYPVDRWLEMCGRVDASMDGLI